MRELTGSVVIRYRNMLYKRLVQRASALDVLGVNKKKKKFLHRQGHLGRKSSSVELAGSSVESSRWFYYIDACQERVRNSFETRLIVSAVWNEAVVGEPRAERDLIIVPRTQQP